MSRIPTTHVRLQGQNIAVFHAKPRHNTAQERTQILAELTHKMRAGGLRVDKAALAYRDGGSIRFWGDPNLVQYLSRQGVPSPTHTLTV